MVENSFRPLASGKTTSGRIRRKAISLLHIPEHHAALGKDKQGIAQPGFPVFVLRIEPQAVYDSLHQKMMHLRFPRWALAKITMKF